MNENMEKNQNLDNQARQPENKRNTFNIIIGVSTLLIAILGATFAYFSATATSKDNDVNVKSAYVSISYDGGTEIKASNLIPSTERVALKMFQKENIFGLLLAKQAKPTERERKRSFRLVFLFSIFHRWPL